MTPLPDQRDVQAAIAAAIAHEAPLLHTGPGANAVALLRALCQQESSGGARWPATLHEQGYCYGGPYYTGDGPGGRPGDDVLREQTRLWGCLAHQSWGPWQLLYITAYEQGFRGDPVLLRDPAISCPFVVKLLNRRVGDVMASPGPEHFLRAYNGGGRPAYVTEAMRHYSAAMGDLDA